MKMLSRRIAAAAIAALSLVTVLSSSPASAATTARDRGEYLALGDSVPFGYNPLLVDPPNPTPAYKYVGYPQFAASALGLHLTNLSCPGETTTSFSEADPVKAAAEDNGCRTFRSFSPLHTNYSGSQAEAATAFLAHHPDTRLITIMLGANDLLLCNQDPGHCANSPDEVRKVIVAAATKIGTLAGQIRGTGYSGRLVFVTYYSTDYNDVQTTKAVAGLDQAIAQVAQNSDLNVEVADAFNAFAAVAKYKNGDTCAAGLLIKLPNGTCDKHPSRTGALLLAGTVLYAVHQASHSAAA